jgi:NTP pyrophosphatase (non-canonical NTP hydrolase)
LQQPTEVRKGAMCDRIGQLLAQILEFREERDWGRFHSLQNLIVSVGIEAGELMETIQWKTEEEVNQLPSDEHLRTAIEQECADVLIYLLLIAHRSGFDLVKAGFDKVQLNAKRYPVEKAKGSAIKYDRL